MIRKRINIRRVLIQIALIPLILSLHDLFAQEEVHYNSIEISAGRYISFHNKTIFCRSDTTLTLADTIDYFISRKDPEQVSDKFYEKIKRRLKRRDNRISRTLYKVTFGKDDKSNKNVHEVESGINYFYPYRNREITSLKLKDLHVFGTSIEDTSKAVPRALEVVNTFHIHTWDRTIKNHLLIQQGDILDPTVAADSERIIRQLAYIKDAKIMVDPRSAAGTEVVVVTRDVFPIRIDYNTALSRKRLSFSNINVLGSGHELETNLDFNDRNRAVSHDSYLKIRNIRGSFISSTINMSNSFAKDGLGLLFHRDFFTPDTRYAGGAEFSRYIIRRIVLPNGQVLGSTSPLTNGAAIQRSTQSTQDIWVGRSFNGLKYLPQFIDLKRWRVLTAARINRVRFVDRPNVSENVNQIFHNRTRLLGSVGLSSRNYYKDVLVNFFGRTEDIPAGNLLQLTAGYEFGEFRSREYLGLRVTKGDFIPDFGYVRGEINYGGFFQNGKVEQGVVEMHLNYFSRLYSFNTLRVRFFVNTRYTVGIRRSGLEIIDLDDPEGIRGFSSIAFSGTRRIVINQESVFFTPFYMGGFRLVVYSFADLARLSGEPVKHRIQTALGVGVRLRNENLAFNTIQLRFAYYPGAPFDLNGRDFTFGTTIPKPIEDFSLTEPSVVRFR